MGWERIHAWDGGCGSNGERKKRVWRESVSGCVSEREVERVSERVSEENERETEGERQSKFIEY